jgi:hypothetical protein
VSYYRALAVALVRSSYGLGHGTAISVQEMLETLAPEQAQERVLVDETRDRQDRLERLTDAIREVLADATRRRVEPPLIESELAPGSFLFRFADNEKLRSEIRALNARFRLFPAMMSALYLLSPDEFELLSARVLKLLGCRAITVTQSQKDDGVDAIAALPLSASTVSGSKLSTSPFYRVVGHLSFLIYVQAKRYAQNDKVGQEEVLELSGSWQAVRNAYFEHTLNPDRADALRYADFRAADPVLMILITTSSFTRGALSKAESLGIATLDGEQLAQLLLACECGVAVDNTGNYAVTVASLKAEIAI